MEDSSDIFTDVPKRTPLTKHELSTDVPNRMKPNPIPFALQEQVKRK